MKCNLPADTELLGSKPTTPRRPHVHFLKGQSTSSLFRPQHPATCEGEVFNGVAVWWDGNNILYFYQLKQNKENPEPISSLPHAANILVSYCRYSSTLLDEISADRTTETLTCCRKICPAKSFVRQKNYQLKIKMCQISIKIYI